MWCDLICRVHNLADMASTMNDGMSHDMDVSLLFMSDDHDFDGDKDHDDREDDDDGKISLVIYMSLFLSVC